MYFRYLALLAALALVLAPIPNAKGAPATPATTTTTTSSSTSTAATTATTTPRHAHWVLRTSSLRRSLDFFTAVFGMKVIRHEENDAACPITCNGRLDASWSKTMVGFATEDVAYALELTYTYGTRQGSYPISGRLGAIAITVPDITASLNAARRLGYAVVEVLDDEEEGGEEREERERKGGQRGQSGRGGGLASVVGPDGYTFRVLAQRAAAAAVEGGSAAKNTAISSGAVEVGAGAAMEVGAGVEMEMETGTGAEADSHAPFTSERFAYVQLHVANVSRSAFWYQDVLGMQVLPAPPGPNNSSSKRLDEAADEATAQSPITVGFASNQVPLILHPAPFSPFSPSSPSLSLLHPTDHDGRHAITLPAATVRSIYTRLRTTAPHRIVHDLVELDEALLGVLLIVIIRDLDGFELCLVSAETFDPAVRQAADWIEPDWGVRRGKIREAASKPPPRMKETAVVPPWVDGKREL